MVKTSATQTGPTGGAPAGAQAVKCGIGSVFDRLGPKENRLKTVLDRSAPPSVFDRLGPLKRTGSNRTAGKRRGLGLRARLGFSPI